MADDDFARMVKWLEDDRLNAPYNPVSYPEHYVSSPSGVECIQITEHMTFCLGNAIKYIWRADQKGGIEDLEKARWYIKREIDRLTAAKVRLDVAGKGKTGAVLHAALRVDDSTGTPVGQSDQ